MRPRINKHLSYTLQALSGQEQVDGWPSPFPQTYYPPSHVALHGMVLPVTFHLGSSFLESQILFLYSSSCHPDHGTDGGRQPPVELRPFTGLLLIQSSMKPTPEGLSEVTLPSDGTK